MTDNHFIQVDEDGFKAFIAAYPNPLVTDVTTICEPPMISWNDPMRAPYWPDSVVASKSLGSSGGRVLADVNSPVPDDGVRKINTPTLDANGNELRVGDRVRVRWGWSTTPNSKSDGRTYDADGNCYQEHTVTLNDPGTKYERLGISGCANHIYSATTWRID